MTWDDTLFDQLEQQGDPPADTVIAQHAAERPELQPVQIVQGIAKHLALPPDKSSQPIQDYLAGKPPLPPWADEDKLKRAGNFFDDNGLWIGMALFGASLPEAYAAARGARVLNLTGAMVDDLVRRVYETAQMIIDSMSNEGGIRPGESGYNDIRRVRLMHAAVRHLVLNDPSVQPPWDRTVSVPLNQEDLLGTLMTFTEIVFCALERMGVGYDRDDAEAYLHRWCVAGCLLGIDGKLLPLTLDDAKEITSVIKRRQHTRSSDGIALGNALIRALQNSIRLKALYPLPPSLVRWYVGAEVASLNGIEGHDSLSRFFDATATLTRALRLNDRRHQQLFNFIVRRLSAHAGRTALKAFDNAGRDGDRGSFALPTQLRRKVRPIVDRRPTFL